MGVSHKRRDAEIFQIRKMIANPAQIAAVIGARLRAIVRTRRFRRLVICRIAIRKSVRHDQVYRRRPA